MVEPQAPVVPDGPSVLAARRTVAAIDLAAFGRNLGTLRARSTPGVELCAVVKADAYGHGAAPIASAALRGGADWLAVATADEAADLRSAGIGARILVLGPVAGRDLAVAVEAGAELVASSAADLRRIAATGAAVGVHVKLDTGMGRLGAADAPEALRLCRAVASTPWLRLAGAMTHFATADDPDDPFFVAQLARFSAWAAVVRRAHPGATIHAANSAALLRDPGAHFDAVRVGVALYGLDPFGADPADHGLEPVLRWTARLGAVRHLPAGRSVGYGRRHVTTGPERVGIVTVGYADGLRRDTAARGGVAEVRGRVVPFVGTVSMDSAAVLLGDGPAEEGDEVVVLGATTSGRSSAEARAAELGTINYEVTCAVGRRVPRVHHSGTPESRS